MQTTTSSSGASVVDWIGDG